MVKGINIILDENDSQSPIMVEIEDDNGKSICIGHRIKRPDGLTALRITAVDIVAAIHDHHDTCRNLRNGGELVKAVKLWREVTGSSLKVAYDSVRDL